MVSEVHVAWRVEGVDHLVALVQADRLELDRDAPLPLDVHRVQELLLHVPGRHGARDLEQTVGQGGLAVVDVGDDRDVADAIERRAGRGHGDLTTLPTARSEEHTSELQSLMRISYAVFCLKKKT